MAELWKSLPSWVRNIVIPIVLLVLLWNVFLFVAGIVGALLGLLIKVLVLVAVGAVVVILVKKAIRS